MPSTAIAIEIDGQQFTIHDDDQEAASLIRRVDRDPREFDLSKVLHHGGEHRFSDKDIVNLKDGDRFVTRPLLHYTIDGVAFKTHDDDQEAGDLLRRAGVDPREFDLARKGPNGAPQTFKDGEVVKIHEGDKFVTVKHDGSVA